MRHLILFFTAIVSISVSAASVFYNSKLVSKIDVDFVPTYFFKVDSTGNLISYTRDINSLWLYNVKSKTAVSVAGEYDPVFLPVVDLAKKFVFTAYRSFGVSMYSYEEPGQAQLLYQDLTHIGLYESAGILSKSNVAKFTFRVMMQSASSQFTIKDYTYNFKNDPMVETLDAVPEAICPGQTLSMAILSKDGNEVVAYDLDDQKTKVFQIVKGEACIVKDDLGGIVGKSSFSYNGNYIAYHSLSSWVYNVDGYVKIPDGTVVGNIYLFDRKTKKHVALTSFTEGTAMYPEFLSNGDIIFVRYINGAAEFYRIKPDAQ